MVPIFAWLRPLHTDRDLSLQYSAKLNDDDADKKRLYPSQVLARCGEHLQCMRPILAEDGQKSNRKSKVVGWSKWLKDVDVDDSRTERQQTVSTRPT